MPPRTPLFLLGAGLLSLGSVALAQSSNSPAPDDQGRHARPPMTRAALQSSLEQRFDAMDANHDGTLTPEERTAKKTEQRTQRRERMFAALDTNGDGAISREEFNAPRARPEGRRDRTDQTADRGTWRGGPMMHHAALWRGSSALWSNKPVTRTQFVENGLAMFDRIDTDHDGTISPAERDAARTAMRGRRAPVTPVPPPSGQ